MSQSYLNSSPERAARVAHYVNLDGAHRDGAARAASRRWRSGARATRPAPIDRRDERVLPGPDAHRDRDVGGVVRRGCTSSSPAGRRGPRGSCPSAGASSSPAARCSSRATPARRGRDARGLRGQPARPGARLGTRPGGHAHARRRRLLGPVPGDGLGAYEFALARPGRGDATTSTSSRSGASDRLVRLLTSRAEHRASTR